MPQTEFLIVPKGAKVAYPFPDATIDEASVLTSELPSGFGTVNFSGNAGDPLTVSIGKADSSTGSTYDTLVLTDQGKKRANPPAAAAISEHFMLMRPAEAAVRYRRSLPTGYQVEAQAVTNEYAAAKGLRTVERPKIVIDHDDWNATRQELSAAFLRVTLVTQGPLVAYSPELAKVFSNFKTMKAVDPRELVYGLTPQPTLDVVNVGIKVTGTDLIIAEPTMGITKLPLELLIAESTELELLAPDPFGNIHTAKLSVMLQDRDTQVKQVPVTSRRATP